MNKILSLAFLCGLISSSQALAGVNWGGTVKNTDGTVMTVYRQVEAADYCNSQGSRLPTISEIAHRAASLGYIKIQETAFPNHEVRPLDKEFKAERDRMDAAGFTAVARIVGIQVFLDFYWAADASPAPAENEFLGHWYWSSSITVDDDGNSTMAYTYCGGNDSGGYAGIDPETLVVGTGPHFEEGPGAFRCVRDQ